MVQTRRNPKPLDRLRLEELALAYVARFATTRAKLEAYLARKLRERGWAEDDAPPQIAELAARFEEAGYIDDEVYARAKAGSLMRRGYGRRRVDQALGHAGVGEAIRDGMDYGERDLRTAALGLARKRRFGPFGQQPPDRSVREKQIAAMLRAGHLMEHVQALIDAHSTIEAEDWAGCEGFDDDE